MLQLLSMDILEHLEVDFMTTEISRKVLEPVEIEQSKLKRPVEDENSRWLLLRVDTQVDINNLC